MEPSQLPLNPQVHGQPPQRAVFHNKLEIVEQTESGLIFGKKAKRVKLTDYDDTDRFAIKVFGDGIDKPKGKIGKNIDWVVIRDKGGDKIIADVSSLASRLGVGKNVIRQWAESHRLETEIEKIIKNYEKDYTLISDFKNKVDNSIFINDLVDIVNEFNVSEIKNKKLQRLFIELKQQVNSEARPDDLINSYIEAMLDQLKSLDYNLPREKLREGSLGNIDVIYGKATPIWGFKPKDAMRVKLNGDYLVNAIKTDGYLYHHRPEATKKHVPYSGDGGKTWVLLSIRSLANRFDLSIEEITKIAANDSDGKELKNRIDSQISRKSLTSVSKWNRTEVMDISEVNGVKAIAVQGKKIDTDGFSYSVRPRATQDYVPYAKYAGAKTWIRLSVESLSKSTFLDPQDIRDAANSKYGAPDFALSNLIENRIKELNQIQTGFMKLYGLIEKAVLNSNFTNISLYQTDLIEFNNSVHKDVNKAANDLINLLNTNVNFYNRSIMSDKLEKIESNFKWSANDPLANASPKENEIKPTLDVVPNKAIEEILEDKEALEDKEIIEAALIALSKLKWKLDKPSYIPRATTVNEILKSMKNIEKNSSNQIIRTAAAAIHDADLENMDKDQFDKFNDGIRKQLKKIK